MSRLLKRIARRVAQTEEDGPRDSSYEAFREYFLAWAERTGEPVAAERLKGANAWADFVGNGVAVEAEQVQRLAEPWTEDELEQHLQQFSDEFGPGGKDERRPGWKWKGGQVKSPYGWRKPDQTPKGLVPLLKRFLALGKKATRQIDKAERQLMGSEYNQEVIAIWEDIGIEMQPLLTQLTALQPACTPAQQQIISQLLEQAGDDPEYMFENCEEAIEQLRDKTKLRQAQYGWRKPGPATHARQLAIVAMVADDCIAEDLADRELVAEVAQTVKIVLARYPNAILRSHDYDFEIIDPSRPDHVQEGGVLVLAGPSGTAIDAWAEAAADLADTR